MKNKKVEKLEKKKRRWKVENQNREKEVKGFPLKYPKRHLWLLKCIHIYIESIIKITAPSWARPNKDGDIHRRGNQSSKGIHSTNVFDGSKSDFQTRNAGFCLLCGSLSAIFPYWHLVAFKKKKELFESLERIQKIFNSDISISKSFQKNFNYFLFFWKWWTQIFLGE